VTWPLGNFDLTSKQSIDRVLIDLDFLFLTNSIFIHYLFWTPLGGRRPTAPPEPPPPLLHVPRALIWALLRPAIGSYRLVTSLLPISTQRVLMLNCCPFVDAFLGRSSSKVEQQGSVMTRRLWGIYRWVPQDGTWAAPSEVAQPT
jgi:hypothetical protein